MAQHTANAKFVELRVAPSVTRSFSGYGSVFDVVDSYGDVVASGAFARSLKQRKGQILMLWQHVTTEPIGVWEEIREDAKGLFVRGTLSDTQRGRDAHTLLKDGALSGLSIGFHTRKSHQDPIRNVRVLDDVELLEISLVSLPANGAARVAEVRAADSRLRLLHEIERMTSRYFHNARMFDLNLLHLQLDVIELQLRRKAAEGSPRHVAHV